MFYYAIKKLIYFTKLNYTQSFILPPGITNGNTNKKVAMG